jgi:hypothetical protein
MEIIRSISLVVALAAVAGCGNPSDVSKGDESGTPSATSCSVTWETDAPASRFTITMDAAEWTTGTHAYSEATPGILELPTGTFRVVSGSFQITTGDLVNGSGISFTDTATHDVLDFASAIVGFAGSGNFVGTWSLGDPSSAAAGSGVITTVVQSACFDVGTTRSYATCVTD